MAKLDTICDKTCWAELKTSFIQATRCEPARELNYWLLHLPNNDRVSCKTVEEARECAASYGYGLVL